MSLSKTQEAAKKMETELRIRFKEDLISGEKETIEWIKTGGITVPTLIFWGYNDPSAKFDPIGLSLLELILSSTAHSQMHIFNHAGHFPFREHPQAFVSVVESFINSNKA
jgi:2-hydroxy-6-oxo-6-(2'-carboxyphenyl)-hexa-2,4-dienoate hydrolase